MLFPKSMLLLVPMLLQVFLLLLPPSVTGVHALALVPAVANTHAVAGVSSVVGPFVTGAHALSDVHAVAGTHAIAGVSAVVGPTIADVLNCIMMSFLLIVLHLSMPEKFSVPWKETFYVPPCRKSLPVPGLVSLQRDFCDCLL